MLSVFLIEKTFRESKTKLLLYIASLFLGVGLFILFSRSDGALSTNSLFERIGYWGEMLGADGLMYALLPANVFSVSSGGGGLEGIGLSTDWDNAFLYFIFAFGIPAFLLLLVVFGCRWRALHKNRYSDLCGEVAIDLSRFLLISTLFLSFTTNIFQGRSWFFVFAIVGSFMFAAIDPRSSMQDAAATKVSDEYPSCSPVYE